MKLIGLLAAAALLAAGCSGTHTHTSGGHGLTLTLPRGWYGLSAPNQLQVANFPLSRTVLGSAERAHVPPDHAHLILWDYGPNVPHLAGGPVDPGPPAFRRSDLGGPFEGFPSGHLYASRSVTYKGEALEVLVDLGPKPVGRSELAAVNRILASLQVAAPRVVEPARGVLAAEGISLRLPSAWSGHIEIPFSRSAVRLVLRARARGVRVTLLELPRSFRSQLLALPVTLKRSGPGFARRVFSTGGRSFDVSAVYSSPKGLERANRLVAGLEVGSISR